MTRPARIPSDINREDRVVGPLTARQAAILTVAGAGLYLAWTAARDLVPLPVFAALALPIAALALTVAVGKRDGVTLDRVLLAAIRYRLSPRHHRTDPSRDDGDPAPAVPAWITANATPTPDQPAGHGPVRLPARRVGTAGGADGAGVVDLGSDGLAVIAAVSTINFALRTPTEQDGLVAGFARYLHSLTADVQILVRAHTLDLTTHIHRLRALTHELPHPALAAAATGHADDLARLARGGDLLVRQVLLVLREPSNADATPARRGAENRLLRRLHDAVALLAPIGISVTALNPEQAVEVLAAACNPDRATTLSGVAAATDIIRRSRSTSTPSPVPPSDAAIGDDADRREDDEAPADDGDDDGWGSDPWTDHPATAGVGGVRRRWWDR